MEDLKISVDKGIQKIIFNRPKKKNAITSEMYKKITEALNSAAVDDSIIMTVLTGEGDFYSSGNDVMEYISYSPDEYSDFSNFIIEASEVLKNFVSAFIDYPKILVALVNGPAIGIAATTLGLCDIVFASHKAYFSTPFTELGLTAEGCSSFTFPRLLGPRKATEMLYFNHKMCAEEAETLGFVTKVIQHDRLHETVWPILFRYVSLPRESLLSVKHLVRSVDRNALHLANVAECRELEQRWQSEEFMNALQRFLTKSKL
ncbi:enoyl-CoA delta isomerase 2-like [Lycorma delicatula]|uniref:enoyl-CoA delta isomerase 2-like n=1 Tax=Lycorma delicatula TaxID=130591 RepID=UPI003F513FA2